MRLQAVLKQRQTPGKSVSSGGSDEGSQSSYPKAPGFERVQISASLNSNFLVFELYMVAYIRHFSLI